MTRAQMNNGDWGFVLIKKNADGTIGDFFAFEDMNAFYEWKEVCPDFCDVSTDEWHMVGMGERALSTGGMAAMYARAFAEGWSDGVKMTIYHDGETIEAWGGMGWFSSAMGWTGECALAGACGLAACEMVGAAGATGLSAASGAAGTGTPAATFYSGPGMQAAASAWSTVNNGIMAANAGASAAFARTVTGPVHVFQNAVTPMPRGGTIWETVEYPILVERGIDIVYHVWDGTQWIIQ
jgi:hypothetical protein